MFEDKVEIALKTAIREMKILDKMVPDYHCFYRYSLHYTLIVALLPRMQLI